MQHIWWTVHVVNIICVVWTILLGVWYGVDFALSQLPVPVAAPSEEKKKQ